MSEPTVTGLDAVLRNLDKRLEALHTACHNAAVEIAATLETYAKQNHLWKPDTGATDNSTRAVILEETTDNIVIALSAGMDYDVYLELARQGKYAWLWPAIQNNRQEILALLEKWTKTAWTY